MMMGLTEIRRRKFQFGLITLVVTLIAYLILMINGLGMGLNEQAGSALRGLDADALAYGGDSDLSVIRSELSGETVVEIGREEGVVDWASLGYLGVNTRNQEDEITPAALLGYEPGSIAEPDVTGGRPLDPGEDRGLLADSTFLKASGLSVGDPLVIPSRLRDFEFTIVGEVDEGYFFFQPVIYLLLDSWRKVKYGPNDPEAPLASVVLLQGESLTGRSTDAFEVVSKDTAFANIEGVQGQQMTVNALQIFGFTIGALVIGIFFYVLTMQKMTQVGLLKALGASNAYVFRQLLLQVLTVTLLGVLISVPLAYATDSALNRLPEAVPIAFTGSTFVLTSVLVVAMGVVGALFSVRQLARVDPIIALGHQE
jgi:putative ABC transport system permease protein